jgi:hypothetical protein
MLGVQQQRAAVSAGGFEDLGAMVGTIYKGYKEGEAVKAGAKVPPPVSPVTPAVTAAPIVPTPPPAVSPPLGAQTHIPSATSPLLAPIPATTISDAAYAGLDIGRRYLYQRYGKQYPRSAGADKFLKLAGLVG